jgi:CIC family chloride channel protein
MKNINFKFLLPVILAVIIGIIVSFAVQGFISFVTLVESFLRGDKHILLGLSKEVLIFSGPVIAGTIVAIIYKLANLDRWHGPAESILAAHVPSKRPNTEAGLLSTLASAVSIAGGASVGQYGPLVHFGGVIGDYFSKLLRDQTSPHILLASGAAAAVSSGFGAPVAGLIFAHEVIVRHFSLKAVAPILISSVVAHTISTEFYESDPLFQLNIGGISNFYEIFPLAILGLLSALVASLYMRGLTGFLPIPKKIPIFFLPIIAGSICGVVGLFYPELLGLGTGTIRLLIEQPHSLAYIAILLLGKLLLTVVCIRFSLFGGIFSPALFIGVMTGAIFSIITSYFFPEINYSLLAVAGMAAVTSCVIGGPISTILIIFELTSDYQVALGAGISVCFANLLSSRIYGHSAFDQLLMNRNIDIHQGRDRLFLASKKISEILSRDFIRLVPEHSAEEMINILSKADNSEGYIISPKGKLLGKISITALIRQKDKNKKPSESLYNKYLFLIEDNSVLEAIDKVKDFVGESIPVINSKGTIVGIISESDLFASLILAEKERNEEELG